MNTSSVKLSI